MPTHFHEGDRWFWEQWIQKIEEVGLAQVYGEGVKVNYHPFFLYCLQWFGWLMGDMEQVKEHLHYLKVFPLLFDMLGATAVFLLLQIQWKNGWLPLLWLLNGAMMYNTLMWGQVDSMHSVAVLLAIIFALKRWDAGSVMLFSLALGIKLQALFFLPVLALVWLPAFPHRWKHLLLGLGAGLLLQLLLFWPFIEAGTLHEFWSRNADVMQRHPRVSANAFNVWYLLTWQTDLYHASDRQTVLGLRYFDWGLLLFFVMSGLALFPILKKAVQHFYEGVILQDSHFRELVFLTAAAIALIFFYFPTQMHERYAHPALGFLFMYSALSGKWGVYVWVSVFYLLNLEAVLQAWQWEHYGILLFDARFIAVGFGFGIAGVLLRLYRGFRKGRTKEDEEVLSVKM